MPDIEKVEVPNPFSPDSWKSEPTVKVIEEAPIEKEVKEETKAVEVENKDEKLSIESKDEKKIESPVIVQEPITFANEESEKVFNLLKEGKSDEVLTILSEQKKLANADKLPAADIIKLNLQYQNKDFSPTEINDLFEETYVFPEKPEQGISEDDDDFKVREEKYNKSVDRINARITRDAKPATAELIKLSKEIVLPDIQKQTLKAIEPTQEELDAKKLQAENFTKSIEENLKSFTGYQSKFKDEEVELNIICPVTKDEKEIIKPLIQLSETNGLEFLTKIGWLDDKGAINSAKMAEDLPFILDKQAIISKFVTETGNQRHAAQIKAEKNIDYSGQKKGSGDMGLTPVEEGRKMVNHFFQA